MLSFHRLESSSKNNPTNRQSWIDSFMPPFGVNNLSLRPYRFSFIHVILIHKGLAKSQLGCGQQVEIQFLINSTFAPTSLLLDWFWDLYIGKTFDVNYWQPILTFWRDFDMFWKCTQQVDYFVAWKKKIVLIKIMGVVHWWSISQKIEVCDETYRGTRSCLIGIEQSCCYQN